jgi:hypothetical protein
MESDTVSFKKEHKEVAVLGALEVAIKNAIQAGADAFNS